MNEKTCMDTVRFVRGSRVAKKTCGVVAYGFTPGLFPRQILYFCKEHFPFAVRINGSGTIIESGEKVDWL